MAITTKTFVATGYAHNIDLVHEFGCAKGPMKLYATVEEFNEDHPEGTRDEYDFPVKVTMTYEIEVNTNMPSEDELETILAEMRVDDNDGVEPWTEAQVREMLLKYPHLTSFEVARRAGWTAWDAQDLMHRMFRAGMPG